MAFLRWLTALGDLAVFNAMYAAALVVIALDSLGLPLTVEVMIPVLASAHATFLLDRVKLSARRLDPADAEARPHRHQLMRAHGLALRSWIVIATAGSCFLFGRIDPWLTPLPLLSVLGVQIYGTEYSGASIKRHLWLKTFATAASLSCWPCFIAWRLGAGTAGAVAVSASLFPLIIADAWLCDLPDADSDRRHGVNTLATHLNRRTVLLSAVILSALSALFAAATVGRHAAQLVLLFHLGAQAFAGSLVIVKTARATSSSPLFWLRDVVDLRLPLVAGALHIASWFF